MASLYLPEKVLLGAALLICHALLAAITSAANETPPQEARFIICKTDAVNFGIGAATGALRYFRNRGEPLIEYISLAEGQRSQVSFVGARWEYGWTHEKLFVKKGRLLIDDRNKESDAMGGRGVITPVVVAPENGIAMFESRGRLASRWLHEVSLSEHPTATTLGIRCKLAEHTENAARTSLALKFMRWTDDRGVRFVAIRPDGDRRELRPDGEVLASKVLVSFQESGVLLEIKYGVPRTVSIKQCPSNIGGSVLEIDMSALNDFDVEIIVEETRHKYSIGNLELGLNEDSGTSFISIGNMPSIFIEAFEGRRSQSDSWPLGSAWVVEGGAKTNAPISAKGKISNDWEIAVDYSDDAVAYSFEHPGSEADSVRLKFPYWLVGCDCESIDGSGAAGYEFGGLPQRIGADMPFGEFKKGSGLNVWITNTEQLALKFESPVSVRSFRDAARKSGNRKEKDAVHSFPPGGLELRPLSKEALFFKVCYRQISRPLEDDGNIMRVAAQKTTNHAVRLSHADGGIKVESPWWAIYHDKKRGGLIASVKFTCASGRNILSGPETLYLFSDGSEYSSVYDRDPSFLLDGETLTVKGGLKSVDGKFCGVTYVTRYEYSDICVKRNTVFYPRNAVKFNRLGVVKLDFIPMLDDCGYKPIVASFKKAIFPGASLVNGSALGFGFLSVFKTGGE
ncbi:MAG: hypothetical protein PHG71_10480, partial [Kiritimatiellae bacterium]|nr:hypothetical protein [Kiritimatiellia bacterium]